MTDPLTVAARLDLYLYNWLDDLLRKNFGWEREALIELIRSADLHAYFQHFFAKPELTDQFASKCLSIQRGIGPLLCALLPKLEQYGDGIPLFPSTDATAAWADHTLDKTGQLAMLRRLAHGERYGLTRGEVHSNEHLSIHIVASNIEASDRKDLDWLTSNTLAHRTERQKYLDSQLRGWARDRIDQYVGIYMGHFICYDSDWELHQLYREQAESLLIASAEADTFPDDVVIGPRTFGEWKAIVITAVARAMLHLSFATRLSAKNTNRLNLRNLLTIHVRQEDLRVVWSQQTGITDDNELDEIADIFMLTTKHAEEYYSHCDYPLPYNIRFGKYFALLPQFGYIGNACTFLVTELKRKYRKEWDKAVNLREAKFQQDIYKLLPAPAYIRGKDNVIVRDGNRTNKTDIDAVLFDKACNCIYLFQLKWFDVFGLRLKERQSKLNNLLKAEEWVDRVNLWVSNVSNRELFSYLGLSKHLPARSVDVRLIVLTRNGARFSGTHKYDERAAWISWPRLCRLVSENKTHPSPLEVAWHAAKTDADAEHQPSGECTEYSFPGLRIDVFS